MGAVVSSSKLETNITSSVVNSTMIKHDQDCTAVVKNLLSVKISNLESSGGIIIDGIYNDSSISLQATCSQLNTASISNSNTIKNNVDNYLANSKKGIDFQVLSSSNQQIATTINESVSNPTVIQTMQACLTDVSAQLDVAFNNFKTTGGTPIKISNIYNTSKINLGTDCASKSLDTQNNVVALDNAVKSTAENTNKGFDLNDAISAYTGMIAAIVIVVVLVIGVGLIIIVKSVLKSPEAMGALTNLSKKAGGGFGSSKKSSKSGYGFGSSKYGYGFGSSKSGYGFGSYKFGQGGDSTTSTQPTKLSGLQIGLYTAAGITIAIAVALTIAVLYLKFSPDQNLSSRLIKMEVLPINKNLWKHKSILFDDDANSSTVPVVKTECYYCPDGRANCAKTDLYTYQQRKQGIDADTKFQYRCVPNSNLTASEDLYKWLDDTPTVVSFVNWTDAEKTAAGALSPPATYKGVITIYDGT